MVQYCLITEQEGWRGRVDTSGGGMHRGGSEGLGCGQSDDLTDDLEANVRAYEVEAFFPAALREGHEGVVVLQLQGGWGKGLL